MTAFCLAFLPFVPLQKATAPHNMLIMGIKLPILVYLLVLENENEVNIWGQKLFLWLAPPPPPFAHPQLSLLSFFVFFFFSLPLICPTKSCPWQIPIFKKQYDKRTIITIWSMLILNWKSYFHKSYNNFSNQIRPLIVSPSCVTVQCVNLLLSNQSCR